MTRMVFLGGWRYWIIYHALLTTNQYVDKWLNNYFHSFYRLAYPHCRPREYILSYLSWYWVILYMPTMMKDYIIHKKCECFSSTFKFLNIQKNPIDMKYTVSILKYRDNFVYCNLNDILVICTRTKKNLMLIN